MSLYPLPTSKGVRSVKFVWNRPRLPGPSRSRPKVNISWNRVHTSRGGVKWGWGFKNRNIGLLVHPWFRTRKEEDRNIIVICLTGNKDWNFSVILVVVRGFIGSFYPDILKSLKSLSDESSKEGSLSRVLRRGKMRVRVGVVWGVGVCVCVWRVKWRSDELPRETTLFGPIVPPPLLRRLVHIKT